MENQPVQRQSAALPIAFTILAWCLLFACAWYVWHEWRLRNEPRQAALMERIQALESEKEALASVLGLEPCVARERVGGASGAVVAPIQGASAPAPAAGANVATPASKPAPVADAAAVEDACVFIISASPDKKLSTGSGFFVAPGHIATNRHVVENAKGRILVTSKALGKPVIGRLIAKSDDANNDFAILAVEAPQGSSARVLDFAPLPKRTDKVGAWGFPDLVGKNDPKYASLLAGEDLTAVPELSYSEGVVSAILDRDPKVIVHTAPISPGNSGGPLVNDKGQVVGINTMITLDEDSYRQASIALAGQELQKFLSEHGVRSSNAK